MTSLKDDIRLAADIEKLHRLEKAVENFSKSCDICISRNCPFYIDCKRKDILNDLLKEN